MSELDTVDIAHRHTHTVAFGIGSFFELILHISSCSMMQCSTWREIYSKDAGCDSVLYSLHVWQDKTRQGDSWDDKDYS